MMGAEGCSGCNGTGQRDGKPCEICRFYTTGHRQGAAQRAPGGGHQTPAEAFPSRLEVQPVETQDQRRGGGEMTALSRLQIRKTADCPVCGAEPGTRCRFTGKGSLKANREGRNHFARMQQAQALWKEQQEAGTELIEEWGR